jgi:Arc/MetJ-type ribon-helix-helix transcriptional regulator
MKLTASTTHLNPLPLTIHLKPEIEALIQKDLERGPYQSVDEFVERAVQMLHEEEALLANDRQVIEDKIERAFGQFERGEGLTPEESRAILQEKKAAWHKQQKPREAISFLRRPTATSLKSGNGLPRTASRWPTGSKLNCTTSLKRKLGCPARGMRKDLTRRPVLFFPLYSYLIVNQHDVDPILIMAVLRGTRNFKRILRHRP